MKNKKIPIFISTFNRKAIVMESLTSLNNSQLPNFVEIIVNDDGSTEPIVEVIKENFPDFKVFKNPHRGIPEGKLEPIRRMIGGYKDIPYFIISDSDMTYSQYWADTLIEIYNDMSKKFKVAVVTGFETSQNNHGIIKRKGGVGWKNSVGGANLLVSREFYDQHPFAKKSWDWEFSKRARNSGWQLLSSVPSICEHIGKKGYFSSVRRYDKAVQFVGENFDSRKVLTEPAAFQKVLIVLGGSLNDLIGGTQLINAMKDAKKPPNSLEVYLHTEISHSKDLLRGGKVPVSWSARPPRGDFDKVFISSKYTGKQSFNAEETFKFNPTDTLENWAKDPMFKDFKLDVTAEYYLPGIKSFISNKKDNLIKEFEPPTDIQKATSMIKHISKFATYSKNSNISGWGHVIEACGCSIEK